jgi:hypothetical protein
MDSEASIGPRGEEEAMPPVAASDHAGDPSPACSAASA